MQYTAVYAGRVVSSNDPTGKRRLILQVPEVLGASNTGWVDAMLPGTTTPASGEKVWVMFASGDPRKPLWLGG